MIKLLKIDRTKKTLSEIEEENIKPELFIKEKEMEDFFAKSDNLNKIFPSWHFLTKQWPISNNRIQDTIIFNPTTLSFAIIEYKLNDHNRIQQILKYRKRLSEEEKKKLVDEAIWEYYSKVNKRGETNIYKYKLWGESEPKLVLINSFDEKESGLSSLPNTSLVKIGIFKLKGENYLYADTDDQELLEKPANHRFKDYQRSGKSENTKVLEKEITNNDYQKTWKKETSEWMEQEIKILQESFSTICPVSRPKSTVVDIKIKEETILTLSWKDGRLNQPKIFLVNPSDLLREKYKDITSKLVDNEGNIYEFLIESSKGFTKIHHLLLDFIKEKF